MLYHVVTRTQKAIDETIVATTTNPANDEIARLADKYGWTCYRYNGHENDVLGRFHEVAQAVRADVVVRVTHDCPCIDPDTIRDVASKVNGRIEFASNTPTPRTGYPDGMDVEAFTLPLLAQADRVVTDMKDRENVTGVIRERARLRFTRYYTQSVKDKLSVDTAEELEFVRRIFSELGDEFTLEEVVRWLRRI